MDKDTRLNKRSIGILIFSLGTGGAERFVSYFVDHLLRQNVDVHLFLMENIVQYPLPKDVNLHVLSATGGNENGLTKLIKLPILARRYAKLVKDLEINHSFSLLTRPNLINILSRKFFSNKAKLIISERSFPSMSYGFPNLQSKTNKFLISKLYPESDLVIGNSYGNAKDLVDNFRLNQNRVISIPNPIDLSKIDRIKPVSGIFDKNFFNLITIGRLVKGKNHQLLINAIATLSNVRLYIIGDGPLRSELRNQTMDLNISDRVFMLGRQSNPFEYLKSADLFVFASNHEGFPNVLLEAMACALPILTTNCKSGPAEILEYDGVNSDSLIITNLGLLVPVDDLRMMKKGIEYFMSQEEYRSSCRITVKKRVKDFDKELILENYTKNIFQ